MMDKDDDNKTMSGNDAQGDVTFVNLTAETIGATTAGTGRFTEVVGVNGITSFGPINITNGNQMNVGQSGTSSTLNVNGSAFLSGKIIVPQTIQSGKELTTGFYNGAVVFPVPFLTIPIVQAQCQSIAGNVMTNAEIFGLSTTGFSYRKWYTDVDTGVIAEAVDEPLLWIAHCGL